VQAKGCYSFARCERNGLIVLLGASKIKIRGEK
jgi:hypothetical protein